jgi:hypothetical protein
MAVGPNEERLDGVNGKTLGAQSKSNISVDASAFSTFKRNLREAVAEAKELRAALRDAAKESGNIQVNAGDGSVVGGSRNYFGNSFSAMPATAGSGGGRGGGGGGNRPRTGLPGAFGDFGDAFLGPKQGTPLAFGALTAQEIGKQITAAVSSVVSKIDNRLERGRAYATSADRYSVQMQQLTGLSQQEFRQQFRMPLTEYRLGIDGINSIVGFQAQTGARLNDNYIKSIEGLRALSGYSKTTTQILEQQKQLMDPEVANRMFMMGGVNAFTFGGGLSNPMQMRQQIAQRMGLMNEDVARSALMPGSVTRARLADMGLGEEMQTEIIQYGMSQNAFKKRGGSGTYDPSNPYHRKLMGIEENLTTQQEETARVEVRREEKFMDRQIDNMSKAEEYNRKMIQFTGFVEDKLSTIVGLLETFSPFRSAGASAARGLSSGAMALGGALLMAPEPTGLTKVAGAAFLAGGALFSAVGGMGDGDADPGAARGGSPATPSHSAGTFSDGSRDNEIMVPSGGRGSSRVPLSEFKRSPRMMNLQPSLRERLLNMMRENPNIGITSGYRDEAEQERLFYAQMEETSADQSQVEWNGKHWKSKAGYAFTAPPGSSMHGVGLAADIFEEGDGKSYAWVVANSARFGLNNWRAKGWRHDEPWHVQPDNVPRFRSQYGGGNWNPAQQRATGGKKTASGYAFAEGVGISLEGDMGQDFGNLSISQQVLAHEARGFQKFLSGGSFQGMVSSSARRTQSALGISVYPRGGTLTPEQVAIMAKDAGWSGDDIATAVAVAGAESDYVSTALNGVPPDLSYGLMQVNMHGDMGPKRRQAFGISTNEELYDPWTNMQAARQVFLWHQQSQGDGWKGWTTHGGSRYESFLPAASAAQYVVESGSEAGDPMPDRTPSRSGSVLTASGSTTNNFNSSPTINVSPVINFNGAPGTPDLRRIAQDVSRMIREEVEMLDLRNA